MSTGWMTVVIALIASLCIASNIVYLAAVTRDLFAFARDNGRRLRARMHAGKLVANVFWWQACPSRAGSAR